MKDISLKKPTKSHTLPAGAWRKAILIENVTMQQAIRNLDETALQIALVVTSGGKLIGTITDGDIRRGLLRGLDMDKSIDSIIHRDPIVVPPQMDREMVLQLMRINRIRQLPVVDEENHVVGLHLWDELITPEQRTNLMVIMAGARLRPHTESCPKPLLRIGGKPMLEHIIERAKSEGFTHFLLAIHYLGHMIREYFGDGSNWQVFIDYLQEQQPLGTAGALGMLETRPDDPFLVTNGDVLTDIHYGEMLDFHTLHGAFATMAVRLHEWQNPFGVVQTKGVDIIGFEEKPLIRSHVNSGIYVIEPDALDVLGRDEYCDMPAFFNRLQERHARTIVYPMHEPWYDIGQADDLDKARESYSGLADD